ncbi:MAG TPA: SprT-like domain-containing protein [Acidobacteriota bacterium]|jgi:hypothetical protein
MDNEGLTEIAREVYLEQGRVKPRLHLVAGFHSYANLNHTIRLRNGRIFLRISDVMRDAPAWALRAIIKILLLKLDRRKISPDLGSAYRCYAESPAVRAKVGQIRRERGRKILNNGAGKFFNLQSTFDQLNSEYFDDQLQVSALSWSKGKTARILGHYDRSHDVIVISRTLDAQWVRPVLFRYILFHEMLHAHLGDQYRDGKRYVHHTAFRREERKFKQYGEAQALMKRFSARIR